MLSSLRTLALTGSLLMLTLLLATGTQAAQDATADAAPPASEIEAVIQELEDPEARQALIEKLRLLARARAAEQAAPTEVKTAAAELMQSVSRSLATFTSGASVLVGVGEYVPEGVGWVREVSADPEQRSYWGEFALRLVLVLALAYGVAALVRHLLRQSRARVRASAKHTFWGRLLWLAILLVLDLLPVAAFAAAGYASLAAIGVMEAARLAALAWINASIIVQVALAVLHFVVAPETPHLRLVAVRDETAHYLHIWTRRLVGTVVYGFFALQAALLLGMRGNLYDSLLGLLGLIVVALLLILILQNRRAVAAAIRGPEETQGSAPVAVLRRRLAPVWHLLAAGYLIVLYGVWALEVRDGFLFILRATALSAVILLAARALLQLAQRIFGHWLALDRELRERFPLLEARVNRYFPILHTVTRWVIHLVAGLALLQTWGAGIFELILSAPGRVLTGTFLSIGGILVGAVVLWEVISSAVERYLAETDTRGRPVPKGARTRTLLTVARNALLVALVVIATLMVLSELGLNIGPLLAGAGVLGLAIGFGAQRLVQDVITGVFILLQDLMSVGDVVKLGDKAGLVEAISIRTVRLRDLSGTVHTIPFSAIDTVSNLTKDFSFYVFDLGVAYREDVDEVMEVLRAIGAELQQDPEVGALILEPLEVFGVDAFGDSAVVIKGRIKTLPIKQWAVGRAFNRLVKKRFDELDIEIPFPHRTLYFGVDKQGTAPPVPLNGRMAVHPAPVEQLREAPVPPSLTPTPKSD